PSAPWCSVWPTSSNPRSRWGFLRYVAPSAPTVLWTPCALLTATGTCTPEGSPQGKWCSNEPGRAVSSRRRSAHPARSDRILVDEGLRKGELEELLGVRTCHLADLGFGHAGELGLDGRLGVGERRVGVRVVALPQDVVDIEIVTIAEADGLLDHAE